MSLVVHKRTGQRPLVLTIAGFDPSSGAGLTADIKTMESLKCYGLSVCTANTVQNDVLFKSCHWTSLEIMKNQIDVLFERFDIDFVKIGIVESWEVLDALISVVLTKNAGVKIILDPVLKSSSNFVFHSKGRQESIFDGILKKIHLITPNYKEIKLLYADKSLEETIAYISKHTSVLLKGGHREDFLGKDVLFHCNGTSFEMLPSDADCTEKHGSGCVLSAAITCFLAQGFSLEAACLKGKRYTEKLLSSTTNLLGYHG